MKFLGLWISLLAAPLLSMPVLAQSDSIKNTLDSLPSTRIQGSVGEVVNGKRVPLVGASVVWAGTSVGTVTDGDGRFEIPAHSIANRLVISYLGYQADTSLITNPAEKLTVILRSEQTLQEVTVSGAPGQIDRINPIQTGRTAEPGHDLNELYFLNEPKQ